MKLANIKKGIVTTLAGLAIVGGSLFMKLSGKEDVAWTETIIAVTFGLTLLGIDDPKFTKKS